MPSIKAPIDHKYPDHVQNFFDNIEEVIQLVHIHDKVAGRTKGRKLGVETLNKSCIVLLTACWETFLEELLNAAFDFLLENCKSHKNIPFNVLTKASFVLKNDKDERKVWDLAGTGWRKVLTRYKQQIVSRELDYFHVPRPDNINELYEKLIGLKNITGHWNWKKMSNPKVVETLNRFIDLRGEISHKLKSSKKVLKKDVVYYVNFINCCGVILHNATCSHLKNLTEKHPWDIYTYKSVM